MDTRRHAPLGRVRPRLVPSSSRSRPHAYLGRTGRPLAEIYISDHADSRRSGRFRWLLSTCLAGAVGVLAILVVIAGSMDTRESAIDFIAGLEERLRQAPRTLRLPAARVDGLRWAIPKTDKLVVPSGAMATLSYIPDGIRQRRGNREYILNKYYVRLVARLAPVPKSRAHSIPPFNPFKLYANTTPLEENDRADAPQEAEVRLLELNGILPSEDGQELDAQEVAALVAQTVEEASDAAGGELLAERAQRAPDAPLPQTSILSKTSFEPEEAADDFPGKVVPPIKVQRGDTLARVLARLGAQSWQVRAMLEATRSIFPETALQPGFEVRAIVLPSPARPGGEPVRFSVFDDAGVHKVTVTRNAAGEYVPSATLTEERIAATLLGESDQAQDNSLYASLHYTAAKQGVPPELINHIMRIHAYTADFRQRVRVGDGIEFFFDVKDEERGIDGALGDLLATFVTSGGETHRFYRFRGSDGGLDFYDAEGSTSRKFLMRRPVRGENVRITSGFGMRRHPLLMTGKMHYGVDWATAHGTPIMAAGDGVIEEAGAKGEYGNYIRIRHANGYKTAYGHMARYAAGVGAGVRVRQGQIVGYVGSTGLSSGPHLHFEVLVNGVHVNPMSIQVPNDRQLAGKDLAEFKRERVRIDELMRRHPVATRVASAGQ
ncbi:MAG: M23 family metallopeptidase [Hyphomonadaceae bacterium]|nr:M23 family metallopeptidase [Hyphomonadaceae bacterium]